MALQAIKLTLPKGKQQKGGRSATPTFNDKQSKLTAPTYRQHLTDLYNSRQINDSRELLNTAVNHDPDVSAAVHAYLTIAGSAELVITAFDADGRMAQDGIDIGRQLLERITTVTDYSVGYSHKSVVDALCEDLRYWMLLRGMTAGELVFDKAKIPTELRLIDPKTLTWEETKPGVYVPKQEKSGGKPIDLNIATFFTSRFHQNPSDVYSYSPFVSAINTIAARTEVINELYRIMQVVGYPRIDIQVMEDVLAQNAPMTVRQDASKLRSFVQDELARITTSIASIKSDQALVHSNAVQAKILNDKNPGAGLNIQQVIDVLDAQNQAALKTMPAVIGKSSNGNVAGTEARLFALATDSLNKSIARMLTQALTLGARLAGFQGRVVAMFRPVELRPELELEPQKVMRQARLQKDLSSGVITDLEYHMALYGRPPHPDAPELSGTNFLTPNAGEAEVDVESISPNQDSLGRSLAPEGGKSAKSKNGGTGDKSGNAVDDG